MQFFTSVKNNQKLGFNSFIYSNIELAAEHQCQIKINDCNLLRDTFPNFGFRPEVITFVNINHRPNPYLAETSVFFCVGWHLLPSSTSVSPLPFFSFEWQKFSVEKNIYLIIFNDFSSANVNI
jgi:hypothetical protein